MSKRYRLKPEHPVQQKIDKLVNLANELGLTFHFMGPSCTVSSTDMPGVILFIEDLEGDSFVTDFPHVWETKTTYSRDE